MGLYRDFETSIPTLGAPELDGLAPAWLARPAGQAWLGAHGDLKDWLAGLAKEAVKARMGGIAPADALPALGSERQLARGITEDEASFRARIVAAWDLWQYGGTAYGLLRALASAGYPTATIQTQTAKQYALAGSERTNLVKYSAKLDNAAWNKIGSTVSADVAMSPVGTLTADKLCEDAALLTLHRLRFIPSPALTAGQAYTFSVHAKAGERTIVQLLIGSEYGRFDLAAGVVAATSGGATGAMTALPDGWFRCSVSATAVGGEQLGVYLINGALQNYDGVAGMGLYLWGLQLETGTVPTAYIESGAAAQGTIDLTLDASGAPVMTTQSMTAPVHLGGSPAELWSDFGLIIPKPWPVRWAGAAPADGSNEQKTFAAQVKAWKPGHARCVKIVVQDGNLWGFGGLAWGQALLKWGQGTATNWTPPAG